MSDEQQDWLTEPVTLQATSIRLSADAMRALKKATGRSMSEMMQDDDDEANRFQVMAFAKLHRRGVQMGHLPDAGTLWEAAGTVDIELEADGPIDPLGGGFSTTSPPSAATGA
jgi:hypothetical protein